MATPVRCEWKQKRNGVFSMYAETAAFTTELDAPITTRVVCERGICVCVRTTAQVLCSDCLAWETLSIDNDTGQL